MVSIPFKRESVFKGERCTRLAGLERVSIPFKRESVFKARTVTFLGSRFASFNSLQTGKCIQSKLVVWLPPEYGDSFQFPSNGKVYSKPTYNQHKKGGTYSFNSLQTGKCIQSSKKLSYRQRILSFNSLQTGKCIQSSQQCSLIRFCRFVSIPFKRESVFKE